jgi:hypothetical protein
MQIVCFLCAECLYIDSKNSHCGDQGGRKPDEERMRRQELDAMNTNKSFHEVLLKSEVVKWGTV